jgi:ATP-binding cassette subfamily F protein 3
MLQIYGLGKSFGGQTLFEDLSLNLLPGEKLGFVGRNGTGKSTLLKIILGEETYDAGKITTPRNYHMGYLRQHLKFSKETILDECIEALTPQQKLEGATYLCEKMLMGLGFAKADFHRKITEFSGGYMLRLHLAKLLVEAPDLMLLDEPTNYLDIVSIKWLAQFLKNYDGSLILVTHDRSFMDAVCTDIGGIHRKNVFKIKGNTTKYFEQIKLQEDLHEAKRENIERQRKEMIQFIERFKAKASKAAQAQSRVKMLAKLESLDELSEIRQMNLRFNYLNTPAKILMEVDDLGFKYTGADKFLFRHLKFVVKPGERIGIIGANGKGKSTLLNLLADFISKEQGVIEGKTSLYHNASVGHFGQTNISRLSNESTILEEIIASNDELPLTRVRQICGSMMFEGDLAEKKIKVLSGGEKARVMLGKILAEPHNILLLDEPTNHLDMDSIDELKEALINFPGAVLVVGHSEHFLKGLVNRLIIYREESAEFFMGSYEDFQEKGGFEQLLGETKVSIKSDAPKVSYKENKKLRQDIILERSRTLKPLKEELEKLEKKIVQIEAEITQFNLQLLKSSLTPEEIAEVTKALAVNQKEVDDLFWAFSEKGQKVEELELAFNLRLEALQ